MVGDVDLEADGAAAARERRRFGRRQQHRAHAAAAHGGRDRDGIEARDQRARAKQHDGVAGEAGVVLRHDHVGARRLQKALQAAAREPVGGEDAMLERGQRVDVAALGLADAHFGDRRMGERGGHRHQQGKHIDTSFDTSFATPPHRPPPVRWRRSPHRRRGIACGFRHFGL